MKQLSFGILYVLALTIAVVLYGCFKNPVTGRSSLNLIDQGTMTQLSNQEYSKFLSGNKAVKGTPDAQMVSRVGSRLVTAIQRYFTDRGQTNVLAGYQWEFNVVNEDQANAWCMPGGKVVVYSGIFPITKTEAGLAVVMGHEIAHAIAQHGNERMSQGLVQQAGGVALSVALANKPAETKNLFNTVYGVGTTLGAVLPYSRKHESEADEMGLIFMAMAGYNPNEAVGFWQRMAQNSGGANPPEILSTHPSNAKRINDIKSFIPKAMQYYKPQ